MTKVDLSRVPAYYHKYINLVSDQELDEAFTHYPAEFISFLQSIPQEKWDFSYAEGKWSIKEMVQHIIDTERIFCYRALCFARQDQTPLPGFEEKDYALNSKAGLRSKEALIEELKSVQNSTALLFRSFDQAMLNEEGTANGNPVYVKGIGYIILGHIKHHESILKERYLQEKTISL
jgi:hypothetical protein